MSEDFKAGDVVVRVEPVLWDEDHAPPLQKPVRVGYVGFGGDRPGLLIRGYPSRHISQEWGAEHFRKLPPADEEFIHRIRSLKQGRVREREDA